MQSPYPTDSTVCLTDPFPGEFYLIRELGHGAFGTVWLADDLSPLGRQVCSNSSASRCQALDALRHEARLLASVSHPHIVAVHAWRQPSGTAQPCLVLQYVRGGSLDTVVARAGPLSWHVAARYIADIAEGLESLHGRGIVHRDIKPANMLHDPATDERLLTDLGIAARLTDPASIAGTALFMAPEAFRGVVVPGLDVYGLAASLFWLVSASAPFDGDSHAALQTAIKQGLPHNDPRFSGLPRLLEDLIRAGLQADPAKRPTLAEFTRGLRGALNLLLADRLARPASESVHLQLIVSKLDDQGVAVPVASSIRQPESSPRDLRRIPPIPDRKTLYTGDRVRLEVRADRPSFVTVFNLGPTGRFNLLFPASRSDGPATVASGQTIHLMDVEIIPPTGRESRSCPA